MAVTLLQRTLNDLVRQFWLTRDEQVIPLVENQGSYSFDSDVMRIWVAELQFGSGDPQTLKQKSIRTVDQDFAGSIFASSSSGQAPECIFLNPTKAGARQVCVLPWPSQSSIVISGATNASPIVITTTTNHGLSDGSAIFIGGVLGNTAANGYFFAKETGYSATTFALYTDSSLTSPVAGTGGYTSGGVLASSSNPFLRLLVSRRVTVTDDTTTLPDSMNDYVEALKAGAWDKWFKMGRGEPQDRASAHQDFIESKGQMQMATGGILAEVRPVTRPYIRKRYKNR